MKNQKNLIILLIPVLILTIAWVIFNVYHSYLNSTISVPLAKDIIPIKGSFDTDTLEQIKNRIRVDLTNDIIIQIEEDNNSSTPSSILDSDIDEDLDFEDNNTTQSAELDEL